MKKQKGQTLVEAILSLAVISVVITAVVIAVISSLNGANYNRDENLALNHAQEGIDVIRDSKSADYDVFVSSYPDNYYCLGKEDSSLIDYSDC
ncbi:MAG: prepilin-type N-terminal cleavage/methylation domain-containing protein, partial [Patescibacteria group bacterium]